MRTVICEKAPKEKPVLFSQLPELCPFCGRPVSGHKSFDPKREKADK